MSDLPSTTTEATPDQRKRALSQAVNNRVAGGYRVQSQTDTDAILVKGKPTNHILHLILSLVTFGFWFLVWPIIWLINKETRLILSVDDYGNVREQSA